MESSRLPGKVMKLLKGKSSFYHHYERLSQCENIGTIYLATSKSETNKVLVEEAERLRIPFYMGAEEDVLERYVSIAEKEAADVIVRCGCDKPLLSYEIIDRLLTAYSGEDLLYVTTPLPLGIGSELMSYTAAVNIRQHYRGPAISKYIVENPHLFKVRGIEVDDVFSRPEFRLTLDTEHDFELIAHLYEEFYEDDSVIDLTEVFRYLDNHPRWSNLNRFVDETPLNEYIAELKTKPIYTIFQSENGKLIVKNRMGRILSLGKDLDPKTWGDLLS
jgi:spore coat polysaccharide biosynthesis protein SpsF